MKIEICPVSGYSEVGRNMTAVRYGDEVVILDMGVSIQALATYEREEGSTKSLSAHQLMDIRAIPDDRKIEEWKPLVKGIVLGHCHYDHIAAVQFLASKYRCPIFGSAYTLQVLRSILRDEDVKVPNKFTIVELDDTIKISDNLKIEFISMSHSTLQCAMIGVHTPDGMVLYANDFKFDNDPVLGDKPNYKRLIDIGKEGKLLVLITECINGLVEGKTPSEKIARELLKAVLLETDSKGKAIFVTTFASNIARIKSAIEFGKKLGRKIVILGRSMSKFNEAAEVLDLVRFSKDAEIIGYGSYRRRKLKEIENNREKYLVITTGSQGEPGSVLDKIVNKQLPFTFREGDIVVFSCRTIPVPMNIANRNNLENMLKANKVRIFTNVHASVLPNTQVVINNDESMRIKEIKDIKEDEKIKVPAFNPDAKIKWYDAKLIKHSYSGKTFGILTKSGRNVTVTSGHSLFRLKNGNLQSIKSDDLKLGDYLVIPKKFSWYKELKEIDILNYVQKNKNNPINYDDSWIYYGGIKLIPRKIKLNKEFARFLGYYLAEGCAPRHLTLTFGNNEDEIISEFIRLGRKILPSNFNIIDRKEVGSKDVVFGARIIGRIFKKWFNSGAKNKKIPDFVFSTNEEFKINFLTTYINGDGHPEKNNKMRRIRMKTSSKKLASDLIYLGTQIGIFIKFDHIQIDKQKLIAGNKRKTKETKAYVLRIQNYDSLLKLKEGLCSRFDKLFKDQPKWKQTYPPESLPLKELNLNEIEAKKYTTMYNYKKMKLNNEHINPDIVKRDSIDIQGVTKLIIDGELAFDPIIDIKESTYTGLVYDFEVPGVENFMGGFGGLMLHNSGHASKEDIREFIDMVKPKHIIPSQGDAAMENAVVKLAEEMGFKLRESIHLVSDGQRISF